MKAQVTTWLPPQTKYFFDRDQFLSLGNSNMALQRLTVLRALMAAQPTAIAAYIVPTADAHNSEYIAPVDARREWLTSFTGSYGCALVTSTQAFVWTDGRYYTQFDQEVDTTLWTLMKQTLPDTPTMSAWLTENLTAGALVALDPTTYTNKEWKALEKDLSVFNMKLVDVKENLVDIAREQLEQLPPPRPCNPLMHLPLNYTGKKAGQKVSELREKMKEKKAAALVITALDEIAWTLNLRGSDIDYNPVFFSYLVITADTVVLFWGQGDLTDDVTRHLRSEMLEVEGRPYDQVFKFLNEFSQELSTSSDKNKAIWLSHDASRAIHAAAAGESTTKNPVRLLSEVSPVALAKVVKNDVELQGMRACHVRDGTALVRFMFWLHKEIAAGAMVTEVIASDVLEQFRSEEKDFMGPSFATIAGAGENGAIIHYKASREGPQRVIKPADMFLLDSGGQYRDGTTDITRTRHMSAKPTAPQRTAYTRVLKGQINMGNSIFPKGIKGSVLDSFARKALWDVGLNYDHGTGHGVGSFLNVHEGPSGISSRVYPDDPGLQPQMVFSNEPGYYEVGEYGIRIEDLVETISVNKDTEHPKASGLIGNFTGRGTLGFRTISLAPHQRALIDVSLLEDEEISTIDTYHTKVLSLVGGALKERGLTEEYEWLKKECAPVGRDTKIFD